MKPKIIVIAHNIRSTHNIGSLFRTCEGLGTSKIYLTGYTPYPKFAQDSRLPHLSAKINSQIHKTALGAEQLVDFEYRENIAEVIELLKSEGWEIAALEQAEGSVAINTYNPPSKTSLILGNEVDGLDQTIVEQCDTVLEIPMFGKKESFNVVIAAGIALFALRFSQQ